MSWLASSGWYSCPTWLKIPNWRNMPSIPNVRDSSGTIGTTREPICLSRSRVLRIRTKAIVVEISHSPLPATWAPKADRSGTGSGVDRSRRTGSQPPSASRRARR